MASLLAVSLISLILDIVDYDPLSLASSLINNTQYWHAFYSLIPFCFSRTLIIVGPGSLTVCNNISRYYCMLLLLQLFLQMTMFFPFPFALHFTPLPLSRSQFSAFLVSLFHDHHQSSYSWRLDSRDCVQEKGLLSFLLKSHLPEVFFFFNHILLSHLAKSTFSLKMPPTYFPLRWESTGDQWWYASPIDCAAANGHYDLVRELLRLDGNHLIKLSSLRRIRRLEAVWDDEEQFHNVTKCRSEVARKLLSECDIKKGKHSLIGAGYGGWLLYTAASAGDLSFVQELLQRDPLLVFGEGEYGVTDILYAAARSKNSEVFRVVLDFAALPRFSTVEGKIGEIPCAYKLEIMNRALHAAARGGNLKLLKELLDDCSDDVLAYRDIQGATVLHAAAAQGQLEVVKDLISHTKTINSTDDQGNLALHVAAHSGHLAVVEALILASPSSVSARNNAGETFLHSVVTGFQIPGFRRLDLQLDLMKHLLSGKLFKTEEIINELNNAGRTALHLAIMGNIHSDLVELYMSVGCINLNIRDMDGMTPLDILRQRPHSPSSELLTRQLISAGGIVGSQDCSARKVVASHIRRQSIGSSPGTSFRVSDIELFFHTGIKNASDGRLRTKLSSYPPEASKQGSDMESYSPRSINKLKGFLHWPKMRKRTSEKAKKLANSTSEGVPVPLRQRFSKPASLSNNKGPLSVQRSTARKKLGSGLNLMHALTVPQRSRYCLQPNDIHELSVISAA